MGAEPVVVLYASISVLNWMRAASGSQCKDTKRGVTWATLHGLHHLEAQMIIITSKCNQNYKPTKMQTTNR